MGVRMPITARRRCQCLAVTLTFRRTELEEEDEAKKRVRGEDRKEKYDTIISHIPIACVEVKFLFNVVIVGRYHH